METYYKILSNPKKDYLHSHGIHFFDTIFSQYPVDAEKIILYINDCYCYKSPWIVEGKAWDIFLAERFRLNGISASLKDAILKYEVPEIVEAIFQYVYHQKQSLWEFKTVKEKTRFDAIATLTSTTASIGDKQKANEMLTSLQKELEDIEERLIQDNQVFNKGQGFSVVEKARSVTQLSIVNIG